jgi:hypothetical protein
MAAIWTQLKTGEGGPNGFRFGGLSTVPAPAMRRRPLSGRDSGPESALLHPESRRTRHP